jgi:hypothetical protein
MDHGHSFEVPIALFRSFLKDGESISVLKAELVREGMALIALVRNAPDSDMHHMQVHKVETFGDDKSRVLWEEQDKSKLRTFADARTHWFGVLSGKTLS